MLNPEALALIAITDDLRDGRDGLVARAAAAVRGGATMVQLRLKDADAVTVVEVARALVASLPVPVIVNDRADVALVAGASGVHLGSDDLPVDAVRRIVPATFIVGASFGRDDELAHARDADYVGIGPFFATDSKRDAGSPLGGDGFARLAAQVACSAVAIGGIDEGNAGMAIAAGAVGVAVIRGIFSAPDPEQAARSLRRAIGR